MNLAQPFREQVERGDGQATSNTFDHVAARAQATWNVEHNGDGTHGTITDLVATEATIGTVTIETATVTEATMSNLTIETITVTEQITNNGGTLIQPTEDSDNGINIQLNVGGSGVPFVTLHDESNILAQHSGFNGSTPEILATVLLLSAGGITYQARNAGNTGGSFSWKDAAGVTLFDSGMWSWTTPAFSASDYTGGGGWTVASGDVTTAAYRVSGKTMKYTTVVLTTDVVGGAPTLSIAIPGGFTAAKTMREFCEIIDNGTRTTGRIGVVAGGTTFVIQKTDATNFAAAAGTTAVSGSIEFEIQ